MILWGRVETMLDGPRGVLGMRERNEIKGYISSITFYINSLIKSICIKFSEI